MSTKVKLTQGVCVSMVALLMGGNAMAATAEGAVTSDRESQRTEFSSRMRAHLKNNSGVQAWDEAEALASAELGTYSSMVLSDSAKKLGERMGLNLRDRMVYRVLNWLQTATGPYSAYQWKKLKDILNLLGNTSARLDPIKATTVRKSVEQWNFRNRAPQDQIPL